MASRVPRDCPQALFPRQASCVPGNPALPGVTGQSNQPPSSDGPHRGRGEARALLRRLPALLPEPSAPGPRLRRVHGQPCSSGAAAQRGPQKRRGLADQWTRALVRGGGSLSGEGLLEEGRSRRRGGPLRGARPAWGLKNRAAGGVLVTRGGLSQGRRGSGEAEPCESGPWVSEEGVGWEGD